MSLYDQVFFLRDIFYSTPFSFTSIVWHAHTVIEIGAIGLTTWSFFICPSSGTNSLELVTTVKVVCLSAKCSMLIKSNAWLACEQNGVGWFSLIFSWSPFETFSLTENWDRSKLSLAPGFSSLCWCNIPWCLWLKAWIQRSVVSLPSYTPLPGSKAELHLPTCWVLLLLLWTRLGPLQGVLCYGYHRSHLLHFQGHREKIQREGRGIHQQPEAFS